MKVIIIISKHRRLTQTHLNTRHTHLQSHLLGMREIDTWGNTKHTHTNTFTDRQGKVWRERSQVRKWIHICTDRKRCCCRSQVLNQNRTLPLWKQVHFQRCFGDECVREVSLNRQVFCRNASNIAENLESRDKPRQQLNPSSTGHKYLFLS